jgi:Uma2 family endonuclease
MAPRVPGLETPIGELVQAYERDGPIPISEADYIRISLGDPGTAWELIGGLLVEKPEMSFAHLNVVALLVRRLTQQLDEDEYIVLSDAGRVRRSARNYLIPDISVVPAHLPASYVREQPRQLGVFDEPLPLVIEAWSPSTGTYDVNTKAPVYRRRGDLEIWHLHPFERTLTVWRRQPNGAYVETVYHGGLVQTASLPGVVINLDGLFV